jgi:peptidoglycan/LPS O-acetylase OafA/YrhL
MRRIQEFDGLRTIAVFIVIADHYAPFRNFANGAPARFGGFGVDVFFVLSGYLITTILLGLKKEERPYQVFYARRFLRILPPYALLLILVYGIAILLHQPLDKSKIFAQIFFLRSFNGTGLVLTRFADVLRGVNHVPGLFHKIASSPIPRDYGWLPMSASLGPTWSLSVEEWFYVLWAPVVLLFRRRIILIIAVLVCIMGFFLRWLGAGGTDFFSSVDILVAGSILALWMERRPILSENDRRRVDIAITWVSILAFAQLIVLTFMHRDLISRTLIEILVFGALAWIIQHTGALNPIFRLLRSPLLVYVGTISYMVYLIHLPMYFVVRSSLAHVTTGWTELSRMWVVAICSVAGSIAFSALSWKYYERPVLGLKDILTARIRSSSKPIRSLNMSEGEV